MGTKHFLALAEKMAAAARRVFYEFRKYSIQPSKFADFLALTNEKIHLRTKHSRLLGYWASEMGGLNQVLHFWEYDSFEQRRLVRKALAEDKEWMETYISKMMPWVAQQDNAVLYMEEPPALPSPTASPGVYSLLSFQVKPGTFHTWNLHPGTLKRTATMAATGTCVGTLRGAVGPLDNVMQLWRFPDGDACLDATQAAQGRQEEESHWLLTSGHTQIMVPTKFSPLQ